MKLSLVVAMMIMIMMRGVDDDNDDDVVNIDNEVLTCLASGKKKELYPSDGVVLGEETLNLGEDERADVAWGEK